VTEVQRTKAGSVLLLGRLCKEASHRVLNVRLKTWGNVD
jgi:hypothetical protein